MKVVFHRSVSVLLALLVLVSTFSFTVDKHFCGSFLVDMAVFSEARTCGMSSHSDSDAMAETAEDSCCTNQKVQVEGQDELKINFDSLDLSDQLFLVSYTFSYVDLFEGLPQQIIPFKDYSPPLLVRDIQLFDQVFLI